MICHEVRGYKKKYSSAEATEEFEIWTSELISS